MRAIAKVKIWGYTIGAIAWDAQRGVAIFEYEDAFLKMGLDISPIKMPIDNARSGSKIFFFPELNRETYHGLPGLFADSLPDRFGQALIDAWLARQGRSPGSFDPVERLCYIGKRGMGALEYEPAIGPGNDVSEPIEIGKLIDLVKDALSEKTKLHTNLRHHIGKGLLDVIRVGTSAGGARAKAIIAYNEKTGDARSGQIDGLDGYGYWIIKFDGATNKQLGDPEGYGKIEYAYHLMARDSGILLPDGRLLHENGRSHFMAKRFDREGNTKLHMQSLCALAHFDYNAAGTYSYEQAFQAIRQLGLPYGNSEELYRRMVFNVVARNQDDHTKNISFLMDMNGNWALSPAYDVTYAYDPANKWMHAHQMSINGKTDGIAMPDLLSVAKAMNIKKPKEIIGQVVASCSGWKKFAKEAGIAPSQSKKIESALMLKI